MTKKADVVAFGDVLESFDTEFSWTNVDNLSSLKQWYDKYKQGVNVELPAEGKATTLICYEMVLFLAARFGILTKDKLKDIYDAHYVNGESWENILNKSYLGSTKAYSTTKHSPLPERGDIIFFNGMGHVALASGTQKDKEAICLSFWGFKPIPTTEGHMSVVTKIEETTIEKLVQYMLDHGPKFQSGNAYQVTVTYTSPPW